MKIKNTVFDLPPPSLHLETNDGTTVTADGYPCDGLDDSAQTLGISGYPKIQT